jgi:hypothetical protein
MAVAHPAVDCGADFVAMQHRLCGGYSRALPRVPLRGLSFAHARKHSQYDQKDHRADKGVNDRPDKAGAEADMEIGEQKTGDYGADDADRDVAKKPEAAAELAKYLPADAFWSALENRPLSPLAGLLQKRRGVRSGLPDLHILYRGKSIYVEMKSHRGLASPAQKKVRSKLLAASAEWWMARTWRTALTALHLSGVPLRPPWTPPPLEPWEGPFADPSERLPQAPEVAAQRREAQQRWRERQKAARIPQQSAA